MLFKVDDHPLNLGPGRSIIFYQDTSKKAISKTYQTETKLNIPIGNAEQLEAKGKGLSRHFQGL
jgi:hypothetical protein